MNTQKLKQGLTRLLSHIFASLAAYAVAFTWLEGGVLTGLVDEYRIN